MEPVEALVRETIAREGPIPFSRFMEMALLSPGGGYYTTRGRVGAGGDFYTSPSAHPLFGWLLAAQLQQMWTLLGEPSPFLVVEVGAGQGTLAADVLDGLARSSGRAAGAARYVAVDPSPPPGPPGARGVSWVAAAGVPLKGIVGCVLSNELLDSLPVHRFQVQGGRPMEVYVGVEGGRLGEVLGEPASPELARRLVESGAWPLPEGYRGEVCLGLEGWAGSVSSALERGFVLTVDYGGATGELYSPGRGGGSLRCYYRHTVSANPYVRVGRQDITAHVDFGELAGAGERHGLSTLGYVTQREFLQNLGAVAYVQALAARSRAGPGSRRRMDGVLGPEEVLGQREQMANRMAMEDLLRPDGMGGFRVLAQGKGVGTPALWGFDPGCARGEALLEGGLAALEVPLRRPAHTPLLEGRYPHLAVETPEAWPPAW